MIGGFILARGLCKRNFWWQWSSIEWHFLCRRSVHTLKKHLVAFNMIIYINSGCTALTDRWMKVVWPKSCLLTCTVFPAALAFQIKAHTESQILFDLIKGHIQDRLQGKFKKQKPKTIKTTKSQTFSKRPRCLKYYIKRLLLAILRVSKFLMSKRWGRIFFITEGKWNFRMGFSYFVVHLVCVMDFGQVFLISHASGPARYVSHSCCPCPSLLSLPRLWNTWDRKTYYFKNNIYV